MRGHQRLSSIALLAVWCAMAGTAHADPTAQTSSGLPPQIIPSAPEVGVTIMDLPGSGNDVAPGSTGTGSTSTEGTSSTGYGDAYAELMATSYGTAAQQAADAADVSIDALAAIAKAESNFQNVPTANGSSSATGPWQITQGTFLQYSNANNLGYTMADMTDPADEAQVASYALASYANTVSKATDQPATVLQTYGAWVFGPTAGGQIANASPDTPLSELVSPQAIANNNMQGWTVGQFDSVMSGRLGSAANETVTTTA
jgi:hypothetical protein